MSTLFLAVKTKKVEKVLRICTVLIFFKVVRVHPEVFENFRGVKVKKLGRGQNKFRGKFFTILLI